MIIASRSAAICHSTDPVAQSLRRFTAVSACLETVSQREPSMSVSLNLGHLYPSIFGVREQPASASRQARTAAAVVSAAAASLALIAGIVRH